MRVRVLHLITDLSTGGTQMVLLRLLRRLDRGRFDPHVGCLFNGDTAIAREIRDAGIEVTDLGMKNKLRWDALWRLYRLLEETRPVILHAWLFHAALAARVFGRFAGVPVVVSSRRAFDFEGSARETMNRMTAWLDDRTIAVSDAVRRAEIERSASPPHRVVTIRNGLEISEYREANPENARALQRALGASGHCAVVGSVGRLHREKGYEHLLRAVPLVLAQEPDVVFLVVGEGPSRGDLETLARELGVSRSVLFVGARSDVPSLLAGMDVFVLPSLHEGLPNAVLEAMASALPVVGTASGGTPEVIAHGETGYLVPPADPEALAEAIVALLRDPGRARAMGRAGRQSVASSFALETTVARTEALYEELLAERFGARGDEAGPTRGTRLTSPAES